MGEELGTGPKLETSPSVPIAPPMATIAPIRGTVVARREPKAMKRMRAAIARPMP